MEKVFVVTTIGVVDYEDIKDITIYKDKEKAKKHFEQAKKEAYRELSSVPDVMVDENETFYSIYEAGAFSENHINVELSEEKIID